MTKPQCRNVPCEKKRAKFYRLMKSSRKRNDEMTAILAGGMSLAYTDAQVQLENCLSPRID